MKLLKVICLLCILNVLTFKLRGQSTDSTSNKENRFFVGLSASPDYCFVRFDGENKMFIPKIAYSFNINLKYRIYKGLSIKTGFAFRNMGFQTPIHDSIFRSPDSGYMSFIRDSIGMRQLGYKNARLVFSYQFYGIPLLLDYRIKTKDGKLFFNFSCGAELDWLSKAHYQIISNNDVAFDNKFEISSNGIPLPNGVTTFKPFPYVTGIINVGVNYKLYKHFSLSLEPSFRYVFMYVQAYGPSGYCWSLGINTGVNYSF